MTLRNGSITMVYQTSSIPSPANATSRVPAQPVAADAQRHTSGPAINLRNGELAGLPADMAQVLQAQPTLTLVKFDNGVSLREQILRNARSPNGGA